MRQLLLVLVAATLFPACFYFGDPPYGAEGQKCWRNPNAQCNKGLVCVDDICRKPSAGDANSTCDVGDSTCTSDNGPCAQGFTATGKNGLCCAQGTRDGGTGDCVPTGSCSLGCVEDADGNCYSPVFASSYPSMLGEVATQVAAGSQHTCALTSTGGVQCWGFNFYGQLGNGGAPIGSKTPVVVAGLTGVVAIVAGGSHTCALTNAGAVQCWGLDGTAANNNVPTVVSGLPSIAAIATGSSHTCALTSAGGVWCWGPNGSGQLGNGTTINSTVPVEVLGLTSAAAVAPGKQHTCALTNAGSVWCWGDNLYGQLGNGTKTNSLAPVEVSGLTSGVVAITAGDTHTCATTRAGGSSATSA